MLLKLNVKHMHYINALNPNSRPPVLCRKKHLTPEGQCLNCGYDPRRQPDKQKKQKNVSY